MGGEGVGSELTIELAVWVLNKLEMLSDAVFKPESRLEGGQVGGLKWKRRHYPGWAHGREGFGRADDWILVEGGDMQVGGLGEETVW